MCGGGGGVVIFPLQKVVQSGSKWFKLVHQTTLHHFFKGKIEEKVGGLIKIKNIQKIN